MSKRYYHFTISALLMSTLFVGSAVALKISAQTSDDSTSGTTQTTAIICAYTLSDWSACSSSGTQTRTILSRTPSGCVDGDIPKLQQSCTYQDPDVPCTYTYSSWSTCSSSGTQTRKVTSQTPSGCVAVADPILQQTCTYTNSDTSAIACSYTLSDWSACSSSGTQTRTILHRDPTGCYDKNMPTLQETCP